MTRKLISMSVVTITLCFVFSCPVQCQELQSDIKKFSNITKNKLKHYVYCLVDPRNSRVFYIGKGQDNRVFAHVNGTLNPNVARGEDKQSLKIDTIKKIHAEGKSVQHYILRHGMDDETARIVESVLIDFCNNSLADQAPALTNLVGGYGHARYGIRTVVQMEAYYTAKELKKHQLPHKILAINVNRLFEEDNKKALYEATRKYWVLSPQKANQADFVACEYRGIIRAIYKVGPKGWQKAQGFDNRYFFEGEEVLDRKITKLYVGKILDKKPGQSNPIWYLY